MTYSTKSNLDSAAGGCLLNKHAVDAFSLIEEMAVNQRQWSAERGGTKVNTNPGVLKIDEVAALQAKVDAMQNMIKKLQVKSVVQNAPCEICSGTDHLMVNCPYLGDEGDSSEQVNALNFNQRPQNDSYNPGMRNHPNLRWRNDQDYSNQYQGNGNQYQNGPNQGPPQKSNLEKMMENLVASQTEFVTVQRQTNTEVADALRSLGTKVELLTTQGRMMETQIAQIGQQVASSSRPNGALPGSLENNPREHVNAVTLGSEQEREEPIMTQKEQITVAEPEDTAGRKEPTLQVTEKSKELQK